MKNEAAKALIKGVTALFVLGMGSLLGKEAVKNSKNMSKKDKKK